MLRPAHRLYSERQLVALLMVEWSQVIPLVATLFGALVSMLLGLVIAKLNGIETHLSKLNGTVFEHVTKPSIHESAVARIDERLSSLLKVCEVAHDRIDKMQQRER